MTFGHTATATSNKARTTPTYIRDVPCDPLRTAPDPRPQGATHVSITEFRWTWQLLAQRAVLCLSPAGLVLLPARFKTDLARTRHMLCLGRKLASLIYDSKIYFPLARRCGKRSTTRVATKIPQRRPIQRCGHEAMVYAERGDRCRLIVTHLEYGPSVGLQNARGICKDRPVGTEPVRPAIQGPVRLPLGHFGRESCNFVTPNIGRVRHHEVVAAVDIVKPARLNEADAVGQAVPLGIVVRHVQSRGIDIGGGRLRIRQCREERQGDGTRSRAEIENSKRPIARGHGGGERERHAHDCFRIGTRIERVGIEAEREAVERALADDP